MFVLKVMDSYNYFSLSRALTLYLTEEFGVSDYRAGFLYGARPGAWLAHALPAIRAACELQCLGFRGCRRVGHAAHGLWVPARRRG